MNLPPAEDAEAKRIAPRRTDADRPLRMTNPPETANELLVGIGRDKGCKRKLSSKAWALDYKPNTKFLFCCSPEILSSRIMSITQLDPESLSRFNRFVPLVEPHNVLRIAVQLLLAGFVCVVAFVSYEVINSTAKSRSLVKEITLATGASVFLGVGTLMAMLGVGLYV